MFRREDESHTAALDLWLLLHSSYILSVLDQSIQDLSAEFEMDHFSSSEPYGYLGLVPLFEKLAHMLELELIVVLFGLRPKFHLLDDYCMLMFLGLFRTLTLLILVLAVIHYPADRRVGLGSNFYEVELLLSCQPETFLGGYDSNLFSVNTDEANRSGADSFIYTGCFNSYRASPPLLVNRAYENKKDGRMPSPHV